jgi:NTE family protein
MGSLVGGLHAAGQLAEYTEWASKLGRGDVLRLLDPSLTAPGAIRAEKVFAIVRELVGDLHIEDLAIPFTAVATDLLARKEVWFQDGPLAVAIRASVAIPGVITPVMLNGRLLADGGLMNPVPIAPTASVQADATVAVSLGGERRGFSGVPDRETSAERPVEEWSDRFRRTAASWFDRDVIKSITGRLGAQRADADDDDGDGFDSLPAGLGKLDVFTQSLEVVESVLSRYRLAGYPPDVLITIPKDACRSLDFHRAAEMIELGRSATEQALDASGLLGTR